MGRPERTDVERLTTSEIAKAAGISSRNFALLIEKNLAPEPAQEAGGQSGSRAYDGVALAQAALVGALYLAGFELLVSARLAEALAEEQNQIYGKLHSNLVAFLQRPFNPKPGYVPWDRINDDVDLERDFWLHNRLRTRTDFYQRGKAILGDFAIEIADHSYIMSNTVGAEGIKVFSPVSADGLPVGLEYRIQGRGAATRIVPVTDEYYLGDVFDNAESRQKLLELEKQYMAARDNAVALVKINVSLAVREAFDRLHDLRQR